jgi:hypothetical protein
MESCFKSIKLEFNSKLKSNEIEHKVKTADYRVYDYYTLVKLTKAHTLSHNLRLNLLEQENFGLKGRFLLASNPEYSVMNSNTELTKELREKQLEEIRNRNNLNHFMRNGKNVVGKT